MAKNNELMVINNTSGIIETNFEETKAWLAKELVTYETVAVTEENLKERKADVKMLSASEKKINSLRLAEKKKFLEPLNKFEDECKELIGMLSDAKTLVKDQTDRFDEEQREIKRQLFKDSIAELLEDIDLPEKYTNRIEMPSEITNVATSKKAIIGEAQAQVFSIKTAHEKEQKNIDFVALQVVSASEMTGLTTPITVNDLGFIDYETMDVAEMTTKITNIAKQRADAEKAAIEAAEARRIAKEKAKAEAEQREKERAEAAIIKAEEEKAVQMAKEIEKVAESKEDEPLPFEPEKNDLSFSEEERELSFTEAPKRIEYVHTLAIRTMSDIETLLNFMADNGIIADVIESEEV